MKKLLILMKEVSAKEIIEETIRIQKENIVGIVGIEFATVNVLKML